MCDNKAKHSKVKPRIVPSASKAVVINENTCGNSEGPASLEDSVPPPTPITVLWQIGIQKCAIPPEEVSEDVLLANAEDGPSAV